ncbi:MAG: type II secretion system protein GspL, partial [Thermodesulfobacteriota bacterium]
MSRPLLIIDIGRDAVRCCAMADSRGETRVFFETPLDGDLKAALSTLVKEMKGAGWGSFSRVFLGVPAEALSLRVVELPITERQKVEEVLPFELSESLLKGTEDFIFEAVTLARGRTMAVALEKSELRQYLDMLRDMGLEPFRVGSALLCKDKLLARLNTAGVPAAFLDNESIIISDGSKPLLYKKITGEIDVKLALADIETEGTEINTFYYCGARAMELVPAGREAIAAQGFEERFTGVRALAEEAREGWRAAVNFRKGEFADTEAF